MIAVVKRTFNQAGACLRLALENCPQCGWKHSFYANSAEWEAGRLTRCPVTGERLRLVPVVDGATAPRGRAWLSSRARLRAEVAQLQAQKNGRQAGGAA